MDDEGFQWLRASQPNSTWLNRIAHRPRVEVRRRGRTRRYRAVPVRQAQRRDRIHELMGEKYRWADRFISLIRDDSESVPVRLEPAGG